MKELYLKHEERFGTVLSNLYAAFTRIGLMKKFYGFIIDDLKESKFRSILDVGTGPGTIPIELSRFKPVRIYAVDPSKSMIAIAERRAGKATRITFALGSSRYLPFKTKFDLIISSLSFHHWEKKKESLQYLKTFLTKGGQIRLYERQRGEKPMLFGLDSHLLDMDKAISVVNSSGLKIVKVKKEGKFVCLALEARSGKRARHPRGISSIHH